MEPLYIVDGSGYIFRAYYAVTQTLSNKDDLPTNALFGFTKMLVKLLRDVEAKYIAVAFDTGKPTFRHEMYDLYKANRAECPEDLVPQMPYFRKIVEAFGIASLEKEGFEADDIIGTISSRISDQGEKVVIVSGDKDLLQLVDGNVSVWDAMQDRKFSAAEVVEKFGVRPEQMVDYLALVGDSSDNIPGIRGVGPKGAQALLNHFGTLEAMLERSQEIEEIKGLRGAKKIRQTVEESAEAVRLSRRLVELDLKVEPYLETANQEEFAWPSVRPDLLVPLFEELEFEKIFDSIPYLTVEDINQFAGNGPAEAIEKKYVTIYAADFSTFVEQLSKEKMFAFDTETTSLDTKVAELVGVSFSWNDHQAFYVPVNHGDDSVSLDKFNQSLGPIFANADIKKVGLNLKYDVNVLEHRGIPVRGIWFDDMLASHLLTPDERQHGLKSLTRRLLGEEMTSFGEMLDGAESIKDVPVERISKYAAHDADASWRLMPVLETELKKEGDSVNSPSPWMAFRSVEMPLVEVLSAMERVGIAVDRHTLDSLSEEFNGELRGLEGRIHQLAGREFNLNSPKQLGEILFEELGIPTKGVRKNKSGYSTDAKVLTKLIDEHPIIAELLEYREIFKLQSTYVDGLTRLIFPETGRIHTSFNQAITSTGRLSSSEPNLQNIPIRNARGRKLREVFVGAPGYKLISADYSQIELRVLAHLSEDKNLQKAFQSDEDIHLRTAKELFGELSNAEELKDLRRIAKTINFGVIYGMGAFRLANELQVSRSQAQDYIDEYFARYPMVRKYFEKVEEKCNESGYVETLFGRRRYLGQVDTSGRDSGYLIRSLLNAPLQGTAAEVIKRAMISLYDALEKYDEDARMVLQVHDELVFEVKEELVDELFALVVSEMEQAVTLDVPLKVDARIGNSWGGES